jgi:hypothetical protein
MNYVDNIRNAVKTLANEAIEFSLLKPAFVGTVQSIGGDENDGDANLCTIQPLDTSRTPVSNISLVSDSNANPLFTPAIGSTVSVSMYDSTSGFICGYGAVKSAAIAGEQHGGMVIAANIVAKLNAIENLLNAFFILFNTHTHSYLNVVTPAVTLVPNSIEGATFNPTTVSEIENIVVKHGTGQVDNTALGIALAAAQEKVDIAKANLKAIKNSLDTATFNFDNTTDSVAKASYKTQTDSLNPILFQKQQIYNAAQAELDAINNQ